MALTVTECFLVVWGTILHICCTGSHAEPGRWRSIFLWWYNSCLVVISYQHTAELCVRIWEWSFPLFILCLLWEEKYPTKSTLIYTYMSFLKWLLTAGRKVHVCWLVVAVKDVFWNVTANRQDGTAACLRVGRYDSLHFPVFHPSISVFPLKTKPVISCRNVVEDLYCVEWSCIINVSLGQLYNEEEDHVLGVFCMFDLVFLLHRSLLLL